MTTSTTDRQRRPTTTTRATTTTTTSTKTIPTNAAINETNRRPMTTSYSNRIMPGVTHPIPTRFTDDELALIDELVEAGVGDNRSAVIRRGVHHLADTLRRARVGATIAQSYRDTPQTAADDDLAMASALALTEAEPW